jgi:hypothetical protein
MDNTVIARAISGVVALILLAVLVGRRKRMASAKRLKTR